MEASKDSLVQHDAGEILCAPESNLLNKVHIGRYMGGLTLFIAGLDEFVSPSGAVWAGGRTMIFEGYKRISQRNDS